MIDKIEKVGSSLIQHGKLNDRIYLMHLEKNDIPILPTQLTELAKKSNYSKIFAKVPSSAVEHFCQNFYFKEAYIPNFYNGKSGMHCLAKFLNHGREFVQPKDALEIQKIVDLSQSIKSSTVSLAEDVVIRRLVEKDASQLVRLYETVFKTYPFPILRVDYIKETMQNSSQYFGAFKGDKLVAASSMEINKDEQNAEMTDFATHADYRGKGLAHALLQMMEKCITDNVKLFYTIARSLSPAMNVTFAKAGYQYGGTLKNNTNIAGKIESMNVWYK
jgi:beta-lysine N6-acetyltransferase